MMTLVVNTLQQLVQRVVKCIRTFISGSKFPASAYLCGRPPTTLADRCVIRLLIVCTTILPHQQLSVCPPFHPPFPPQAQISRDGKEVLLCSGSVLFGFLKLQGSVCFEFAKLVRFVRVYLFKHRRQRAETTYMPVKPVQ